MKKYLGFMGLFLIVPMIMFAQANKETVNLNTISQQLNVVIQEIRDTRTQLALQVEEFAKQVAEQTVEQTPEPIILGGSGFGVTSCALGNGTTTYNYLNAGAATTTFSSSSLCDSSRAESMDLNIVAKATTTAILQWALQWSNNNVDWYNESCKTVNSINLQTHGACYNQLALQNSNASTSVNITITPTASQFMRIRFEAVTGNLVFSAERTQKEPNMR